jgi:Putative auto-transporter adhesin, head GIN domain
MKNKIIKLIALLFFVTLSYSFAGDKTQRYDYKSFRTVSVGYGMKVDISQSDSYSIEVNADERDFEYLEVEKDGDELRFYIDKNFYHKKSDINIKISMPVLTAINLSGGSIGNIVMNVSSKDFDCGLSGGSILKGELQCSNIEMGLSGGSQVTLRGSGKDTEIDGSGGSIFNLKDFKVQDADVSLSGGSQVSINMNGTLNADQSGGSQVTYYGKVDLGNTSFSGGSEIRKGD